MSRRYLATLRAAFAAEDDVEAELVANELAEHCGGMLDQEDGDSATVTQVIPYDLAKTVEPTEVCNQMRLARDLLIKTRVKQLFELAQQLDKAAWILEHRAEETFDLSGYDYGTFFDRAGELLGRKPE